MRKYPGMPELLEQFMQEQDAEEHWITVQELRDRFGLTRYQCNTVSGFLRRLEFGTFGRFSYRVLKIEQVKGAGPSDPPKCRYLIKCKHSRREDLPGKQREMGPECATISVRGNTGNGATSQQGAHPDDHGTILI
ncbi:hypothetical protein [Methanoregula sp.]|jgi:hypothetical protein|uniref:hypothetical protein n=2 Tax=Methanoregula sp. TaxID=2052170 RepID=UPI0025FB1FD5|nr:hypothetical protein [Methanoregula sp.]